MVLIKVSGLKKNDGDSEQHCIEKDLPWDTEISRIFQESFGDFCQPEKIVRPAAPNRSSIDFDRHALVREELPMQELKIVADRPSNFAASEINIDDTLLHFSSLENDHDPPTVELCVPTVASGCEEILVDEDLRIKFHRTVRMPDDGRIHQLPGSLGAFPLYNINAFSERLPQHVAKAGGVFFPMWQREALWIQMGCERRTSYAVRINVGNINAISGLNVKEKSGTQDYVVVPGQPWVDGIAIEPGVVRQFVAMPLGSGYTVEGQVTGEEKFGGFQIEVTPSYHEFHRKAFMCNADETDLNLVYRVHPNKCVELDKRYTPRYYKLGEGKTIRMAPKPWNIPRSARLSDLLQPGEAAGDVGTLVLEADYCGGRLVNSLEPRPGSVSMTGSPRNYSNSTHVRFYGYTPITSSPRNYTDSNHSRTNSSTSMGSVSMAGSPRNYTDSNHSETYSSISMPRRPLKILPHLGINKPVPAKVEVMGIAAGGKLIQDLKRDHNPGHIWNAARTRLINIHMFSPASFEAVTHIVPHGTPVTAKDYADLGMLFFSVEEDPDNRLEGSETLDAVKSVGQMDQQAGVDISGAPSTDTKTLKRCEICKTRLCDCIVRPCNHQFCCSCINQEDTPTGEQRICPAAECGVEILRISGFSAPMNLPGEEAFKVFVPVVVLKVEDGRTKFESIQKMRI